MKKNYINPDVLVSTLETVSFLCASPAGPGSGGSKLNEIETDEQW